MDEKHQINQSIYHFFSSVLCIIYTDVRFVSRDGIFIHLTHQGKILMFGLYSNICHFILWILTPVKDFDNKYKSVNGAMIVICSIS